MSVETPTHMSAEVAEIPAAAARFLDGSREQIVAAAAAMRAIDPRLIVTVARGSSDHAASYLKYAAEIVAGVPVASVGPSVASIYGRQLRLDGAACIGVSQSGQSPDIVEMMRSARAGGALTVAVTNDARLADGGGLRSRAAAAGGRGAERGGDEDLRDPRCSRGWRWWRSGARTMNCARRWRRCRGSSRQALACDWAPLADRLVRANQAFVLGRGPGFAIANEVALKFKETSAIHAESYSAAEVLHGPAALVQAHFPVLALGVADAALPQVIATAERLAGQGADVFLTARGPAPGVTQLPSVAGVHPLTAPLVLVVSFYRFIEALARRRGFNPDTPPYLRKVTETV